MRYEFDQAKLAANVSKHQVWFSAAENFEWETAQLDARLFVLTFTLRGNAVRIISLRKANQREVRRYVRHA